MSQTSTVIFALVLFWSLQIAGTWMQWKHYHGAIAAIRQRWSDGYVGVGRFRRKFRFGCVAVVVVTPDMRVRSLKLLNGISVFARFRDVPTGAGLNLQQLPAQLEREKRGEKCLMAVHDAIKQIEEIRAKTENA